MIEKMKFLSITGPKEDIDRVMGQYLCRYEIQLENALSELKTVTDLHPFVEINPYREAWQKISYLKKKLDALPGGPSPADGGEGVGWEDSGEEALKAALTTAESLHHTLKGLEEKQAELEEQIEQIRLDCEKILPFQELNFDLATILHFTHIKFRFGRIPREYFGQFDRDTCHRLDLIVHKCRDDGTYVSIVYFTPAVISKKIDAIFASYHFERLIVPDGYTGTPEDALRALHDRQAELEGLRLAAAREEENLLTANWKSILRSYRRLRSYCENFDVRRLAACTSHSANTFYILCGWMTERDADSLRRELEQDERIFCYLEDEHGNLLTPPPTKLKNPELFKPFELFIKMYGMPSYHEIDPTILIGLTYSVLFGFMFGDLGQGLLLLAAGLLIYRTKKMGLAAIISCCGFFSAVFGLLFGSVFGFEDILEPLWLRPASHMTKLPFIGRLNTVFVAAIAIGMGIIVLTMALNVVNALRSKDVERACFDQNGLAGLIFYGSALWAILLFMTGRALPAAAVLAVLFGLPLLAIFLKEPLTALVTRQAEKLPKEKAMFFVQGVFELFELLLSYFSNTLSFVRVGAFAVSHAAMMEVVMMLAGAESGQLNWAAVVLGNLFVCAMEGLIVGIQVLRLEYYEIFSRFYRGTGREFIPYQKQDSL